MEVEAGLIDWTKLPSLTALRALEAVARAKSFSAAARSLNVTHAAVAQQIKGLEEYLEIQLAVRSPAGVKLTPLGEELASSLRAGFTAIAEGIRTVREGDRGRPIRVTTTAFFAEAVVFPRIASFWRANPGKEISFSSSDKNVDIVAEKFDLAIRAGSGCWPGLTAIPLMQSPTLAFAAPSLVDDPDTDWSQVPWLFPDDSFWEREALQQSGIDTSKLITKDLGDPVLEVRAGEEGIGLVLESEIDVRAQLRKGSLKVAPIKIRHQSAYFVVTPPWPPRPSVARFIEWLRELGRQVAEEEVAL